MVGVQVLGEEVLHGVTISRMGRKVKNKKKK
jgi:hypothetical protein